MFKVIRRLVADPDIYYHIRNLALGGLPLRDWTQLFGLRDASERFADLGCGPADLLRHLSPTVKPKFYLGLDTSEDYLESGRKKARKIGLDAEFVNFDLQNIATEKQRENDLKALFVRHDINRVLALGLLHHIDDESVVGLLDVIRNIEGVRSVFTADVVYLPGKAFNNFLAKNDRGHHVRTESQYDELVKKAGWREIRKQWSSPGISAISYLLYVLQK